MKPKSGALLGMTASTAIGGLLVAWFAFAKPPVLTEGIMTALFSFFWMLFPFAWLLEDRKECGLPRSYWFNVGVVNLAGIVVPAYLWRSRPRGKKLLALLGLAGVLFAGLFIMLGSAIAATIGFTLVHG